MAVIAKYRAKCPTCERVMEISSETETRHPWPVGRICPYCEKDFVFYEPQPLKESPQMPTDAEIRAGNLNVIGTMRHAVRCPLIQSGGSEPCDCSPLDDSKAMTHEDVLRIFAPLPPEECGFLDYI